MIKFTTGLLSPESHLTEDETIIGRPMVKTEIGWQFCTAEEIVQWVAFDGYKPGQAKQISQKSSRSGGWTQEVIIILESA
jgi:hypothetical protein